MVPWKVLSQGAQKLLTAPPKTGLSPLSLAGFSAPNWTLRPKGMPNQSQHLLPPPAGGHWVLYFTDTVAPFPRGTADGKRSVSRPVVVS